MRADVEPVIRPYAQADEHAVVALWRECLPGSAPHHDPITSIRNKLDVDPELFLVACHDNAVVGTTMAGYDGHRGWIYSVAVAPSYRRRGIGAALIRDAEHRLIARGCLKVNLQVLVSNAEVVEFYKRLGYDVEERISMGKRLY